MRKFLWPLQRLLHVTEQRERAMRLEVLAAVQQAAIVKRQILRRQAVLRDLLAGLSRDPIERRIPRQEVFMNHVRSEERVLAGLQKELDELQRRREQVTAELMKIRSSRKSLERLRAEALRKYRQEQARWEQKQFDESAQLAFVAKAAEARLAVR